MYTKAPVQQALGGPLSVIGSIGKGVLDYYSQTQQTIGEKEAYKQMLAQQQAQQQSSTPPWLVPVAIGGVGLVLVLALTK